MFTYLKKCYQEMLLSILCLAMMGLLIPTVSMAKPYGKTLCKRSGYTCYVTQKIDTWDNLFPNSQVRDLVKRINRMNTPLYRGITLAIPDNLSDADFMKQSPFPDRINPRGSKLIFVSLTAQAFGAYDENGSLVYWGPISAGKGWCPDLGAQCSTPTGSFYIYTKGDDGCKSSKFPIGKGGAPMPHCMFFYHGFALHASPLPGYHASHGCVRLLDEDAQWLNHHFVTLGTKNRTQVVIRKTDFLEEDTHG